MKEITFNREPSSEEGGSSLFIKCQSQALVYLGIREHNRKELFTKLRTKGYEVDLIDSVLDSLVEDGSLSEERYVRSFVRSSNKRHPEGRLVMARRLAAKGADREVCEAVLSEVYTEQYTRSLVCQARDTVERKGKARTEEEIRFCLKKLGFSNKDISLND